MSCSRYLLAVRVPVQQGWYSNDVSINAEALISQTPTYPMHIIPKFNIKLQ